MKHKTEWISVLGKGDESLINIFFDFKEKDLIELANGNIYQIFYDEQEEDFFYDYGIENVSLEWGEYEGAETPMYINPILCDIVAVYRKDDKFSLKCIWKEI